MFIDGAHPSHLHMRLAVGEEHVLRAPLYRKSAAGIGCLSETRPGKLSHNELERSTMLLMGKTTIFMVIFNSYVTN